MKEFDGLEWHALDSFLPGMSLAGQSLLTADEYPAAERVAETKSEYHDGQVLASRV